MDIKNLILIIVAVLNFFVALLIFLRNNKSPINISFSLLLLSVVGWSLGLAVYREYVGTITSERLSKVVYYFATLISYFFVYFSLVFPIISKNLKNKMFFFSIITLPIFYILIKDLLITELIENDWGYDMIFNPFCYFIYSFHFIFLMIYAYINLILNYIKSSGYVKFQLRIILTGTLLSGILGMIFNLFFPYFNLTSLEYLGPYFTIIVLFIISYLIFFKTRSTN